MSSAYWIAVALALPLLLTALVLAACRAGGEAERRGALQVVREVARDDSRGEGRDRSAG